MSNDNTAIEVEKHDSLSKMPSMNMGVVGLEEIPASMIPVPFYKLVQPGSTNVSMADGNDAPAGSILMADNGVAVDGLRFLLLRAKRQKREFTDENGRVTNALTIGLLGLNLDRMTPFILSVSLASFSNFGQLMARIKEAGLEHAWDREITLSTQKVETKKDTGRGMQTVKFWVIKFDLASDPVEDDILQSAQEAYTEFSMSLDGREIENVENMSDEELDNIPV